MTIATKSGALIVKDGKLADGCGCCGCSHGSCACPDFCAYTANGSFEGLSADSGQCSCSESFKNEQKSTATFAYDGLITGWSTVLSQTTRLTAGVSRSNKSMAVQGQSLATYSRVPSPGELERLSCSASDLTDIRCEEIPPGSYTLGRIQTVAVSYFDSRINVFSNIVGITLQKFQSFAVSLSCEKMGDRSCSTSQSNDCRRYVTDPFPLPPLTSAWTRFSFGQRTYPSQFAYVEALAESIADALDASPVTGTFGIFESCNPLP